MAKAPTLVAIAEIRATDSGVVVWRVASGPAWQTVGGSRVLAGGHMPGMPDLEGVERQREATESALIDVGHRLGLMERWIANVRPLPYGGVEVVGEVTPRRP